MPGCGRSPQVAAVLEQAVTAHREAVRLKPDDPEAHSNVGFALTWQGKFDAAKKWRAERANFPATKPAENNDAVAHMKQPSSIDASGCSSAQVGETSAMRGSRPRRSIPKDCTIGDIVPPVCKSLLHHTRPGARC
jgi:hypothetical protein